MLRVAGSLLLVLAAAACTSSSPLSTQPDSDEPAPRASITIPPEPDASSARSIAATPGMPASTLEGTPKERPKGMSEQEWRNSAPLELLLNRTCLDRGQELIATVRTQRRAGVGFAVGYSDPPEGAEAIVPDYAYFDRATNQTGEVTWSFVVRPTVPYGPAVLKVVVAGTDGRGATRSVPLEISSEC